jgi:hypothetical protein
MALAQGSRGTHGGGAAFNRPEFLFACCDDEILLWVRQDHEWI